jgi:predicted ABC-type ATPase
MKNFFGLYKNLADNWIIYDNSNEIPAIVAKGNTLLDNKIFNHELWTKIVSIK